MLLFGAPACAGHARQPSKGHAKPAAEPPRCFTGCAARRGLSMTPLGEAASNPSSLQVPAMSFASRFLARSYRPPAEATDESGEEIAAASRAEEARRALMARIGEFVESHDLAVTPSNLANHLRRAVGIAPGIGAGLLPRARLRASRSTSAGSTRWGGSTLMAIRASPSLKR